MQRIDVEFRRGTQTLVTQMASGYEPPSMSLTPCPAESPASGSAGTNPAPTPDRRPMQRLNLAGVAMIPPPLDVRPELTDDDVDWLNTQLQLGGRPPVVYARQLPKPPLPPSGRTPAWADTIAVPSGHRPPPDTGWITMTTVRG